MKRRKKSPVRTSKIAAAPAPESISAGKKDSKNLLVVAIGAAASGYDAFLELFRHLPADTGMAFVLVHHFEPRREGKLLEKASHDSPIPIVRLTGTVDPKPNHIYVLPRDHGVSFADGKFSPKPKGRGTAFNRTIDLCFEHLAEEKANLAIGVILSGEGTDGTLGSKKIRAAGGITFAQHENGRDKTAASAIASGAIDYALPPAMIARELIRIAKHPILNSDLVDSEIPDTRMAAIFSMLRALHGVDFRLYKPNTLKRRILRRMVLKKFDSLPNYLAYIQQNPGELDALFQDLLINVTSFFRDAQLFRALNRSVFPKILKKRGTREPVRVWVPGCSTGEEVYSLAISFFELERKDHSSKTIQIFGTDVSEGVLARARAGLYPESIAKDVSPDQLRRFFVKTDGGYQIAKFVRDCCVFARQNVVEDPPFSKIDLISCRNLLIYLGPQLQKKVIPIFHYALKRDGYLVLGGSETIGLFSDMFVLLDKKNKIYQRGERDVSSEMGFATKALTFGPVDIPRKVENSEISPPVDLQTQVDRMLLGHYAPGGVLINSRMEVLQFRGRTSEYLEHSPGEASLNLMKMVKHDLLVDLRTAVTRAIKLETVIRKEGICHNVQGKRKMVHLQIVPIRGVGGERFFLVLFEDGGVVESKNQTRVTSRSAAHGEVSRLREELGSTKESLQTIIEEQEATNEELKSANEEIQSSNEELQSTNEELETAKEELQSTNEELTTLNEELQTRNCELNQLNNDLSNLLSSVSMPILMLGNDLTIRSFTPLAERCFNLIPSDIGRRISDINPNIQIANFDKMVLSVLDSLSIQEHEVQDREGRWYSLRIRPYRTAENKIDGAVVLLVDIDELKRGVDEITRLIRQPLLTLHGDFRVSKANDAFYRKFQMSREETEGRVLFEIDGQGWRIPALKALLEGLLPEKHRVENFEVKHDFPRIGWRHLALNAVRINQQTKGTQLILLAIEDLTPRNAFSNSADSGS
jgi:two-component system CheB/CheR fusion protein